MKGILATALVLLAVTVAPAQQRPLPIIDVHLHAEAADAQGPPPLGMCTPLPDMIGDSTRPWPEVFLEAFKKPPCKSPIWSPATDQALMNESLAVMKRRNVYGVVSGEMKYVEQWRAADPERVMPAIEFELGPNSPRVDEIAQLHERKQIVVFGEVSNQYVGVTPNDPGFEPYLAMAEQRDLPVGIHIGTGPPGAPYLAFPKYRASLHSALLLEEVLLRHPKLRIYVMHAGWPMIDDMLAVMWAHPQVYVDTGVIDYVLPRAEFHRYLQRIVEAGFGKRVLFGSDQMVWPGAIDYAIESIESAPFLSDAQKRDILYNNAARFLRLSDQDIARHHGRASPQPQAQVRSDLPQPYRTTRDWGQLPPGVKWAAVTAVEPAPDGTIYVIHRCFANSCANRSEAPILKYDASGKLLASWGSGMFIFPHGATVDRDGNLWVTDARAENGIGHQVFKFDRNGKVLMTLGKKGVSGSGPGLFDQPTDVVIAPNGDIFVTDSHRNGKNNRVVKFTRAGTFVKEWGKKGSGRGEISEPHTIAMDSRGRLFVGDRENNRIQIFDQDGQWIDEWRQFGRPSGIYITSDDTIYVADSESGPDTGAHELMGIKKGIRIGSAKDGRVTAFIEDMESTAADHSGAEGVGVDAQGHVYGAVVRRQMLERHVRK
jgi:uncharacterized protein